MALRQEWKAARRSPSPGFGGFIAAFATCVGSSVADADQMLADAEGPAWRSNCQSAQITLYGCCISLRGSPSAMISAKLHLQDITRIVYPLQWRF